MGQALQHQNAVSYDLGVRRKTAVRVGVECRESGDAIGIAPGEDRRGGKIAAPAIEGGVLRNDEQNLGRRDPRECAQDERAGPFDQTGDAGAPSAVLQTAPERLEKRRRQQRSPRRHPVVHGTRRITARAGIAPTDAPGRPRGWGSLTPG